MNKDYMENGEEMQNKGMDTEESVDGVYKFVKPIDVDGETLKQVSYNFDDIKPIQYINLVKRAEKQKGTVSVPELDMDIQIGLFSLASGLPVTAIKNVNSLKDLNRICRLSRDFLLDGSGDANEQE